MKKQLILLLAGIVFLQSSMASFPSTDQIWKSYQKQTPIPEEVKRQNILEKIKADYNAKVDDLVNRVIVKPQVQAENSIKSWIYGYAQKAHDAIVNTGVNLINGSDQTKNQNQRDLSNAQIELNVMQEIQKLKEQEVQALQAQEMQRLQAEVQRLKAIEKTVHSAEF